jgi:hypothetical protein
MIILANKTKYSTIKTKRQLIAEKYKFEVGDAVKYLGGLYPELKNVKAKVLGRSCSKSFNNYEVEFENGKILTLREAWIAKFEESDAAYET